MLTLLCVCVFPSISSTPPLTNGAMCIQLQGSGRDFNTAGLRSFITQFIATLRMSSLSRHYNRPDRIELFLTCVLAFVVVYCIIIIILLGQSVIMKHPMHFAQARPPMSCIPLVIMVMGECDS